MKASIYTRPDKPLFMPVTRRRDRSPAPASPVATLPQPVIVHGSTDCFVTPPEVAARMADYAQLEDGHRVCDPEAGTGNLLQAVIDSGLDVDLRGNELNAELMHQLQQRFDDQPRLTLTQGDFLETTREFVTGQPAAGGQVDCFMMNPPYSRRQAYQHVNHARQLLAENGLIIALVPCTFEVAGMVELEQLPAGTFAATEVRTKMIEIAA